MEPVLIAGAGTGGLTLAAGLAGRGIPAVVLEQADQLAPVGRG
ncbi:FAD-dependent monooxygenase [Nonomuraea sp. NPDC000554]